ncbi:recombinase zinc beta ribbon domain-containing protein [Desulfitobacterium hafniense]|uniref:recombinase zinc beta ribbon domain-containing protein n=1 Tax=Desulfitobacterium hafniense TaxID=49338 RepID=UPI0009B7ACFC
MIRSHPDWIFAGVFHDIESGLRRRGRGTTQHKRIYSGRYALSGMVFCAHCRDIYRRIKWNNRGCKSTVWRCVSRVEKDGPDCSARTVHEELLHEVVVKAINEAFREKEYLLPFLRGNIESSLEENAGDRIAAVDEKIKALQQELLATADMKNSGDELVGMEIRRLRDEKQAIQTEEASRQDLKERIDELMDFLNGLPCDLIEYDEQYVRALLEKITVYDDHFIVEFKSGIEIQIDE